RSNRVQLGFPAEDRGGKADRRQGMTQIVLAIAERPLAVFPRFPPRNGRECHVKVSGRCPFPSTPQFQRVIPAQIVIRSAGRTYSLDRWEQRIGFGGMEISA